VNDGRGNLKITLIGLDWHEDGITSNAYKTGLPEAGTGEG